FSMPLHALTLTAIPVSRAFIPAAPDYQPHPFWLYLNPPPGLFESAPAPRLRTPGGGFTRLDAVQPVQRVHRLQQLLLRRPRIDSGGFRAGVASELHRRPQITSVVVHRRQRRVPELVGSHPPDPRSTTHFRHPVVDRGPRHMSPAPAREHVRERRNVGS